MSKVICDVCGTSYPETSTQCPICGCVRPADAQSVIVDNGEEKTASTYQHVKGGKFSKTNVRKRNTSSQSVSRQAEVKAPKKEKGKKKNTGNTGLMITIFVLLLAILAVIGYIAVKFFIPTSADKEADKVTTGIVDDVSVENAGVVCQAITLDAYEVILNEIGQQVTLNAVLDPANTTDEIRFSSNNEAVAAVDQSGIITAADFGEAVITITCGDATAQCDVFVTEPFALDTESVTFTSIGETETIYSGSIAASDISWTSDDDTIAVVVDGVVTAVDDGSTKVYGEYKDLKLSCTVTCDIPEQTDPPEETQASVSSGVAPGPYKLKNLIGVSSSDVTLSVGESFILALLDANGNKITDVKWTVEGGSCCTVSNGTVKAVSSGQVKVVATYNGETFKCTVRVN